MFLFPISLTQHRPRCHSPDVPILSFSWLEPAGKATDVERYHQPVIPVAEPAHTCHCVPTVAPPTY